MTAHKYEGVINSLGYEILEPFLNGSCLVYMVSDRAGNTRVLKMPSNRGDLNALRQIQTEWRALARAEDVQGVPHKIDFHDETSSDFPKVTRYAGINNLVMMRKKLIFLLREHIDGRIMGVREVLSDKQMEFIRKTMSKLHDSGVAGFDFDSYNFVISKENGMPYFIDLGYSITDSAVSRNEFRRIKDRDLWRLEDFMIA